VVARAIEAGVEKMLLPNIDLATVPAMLDLAKAEGSKQFIHPFHIRSQDFCQAAGADASYHFHLEEAILGVDVAHGVVGIGGILGVDVRDAVFVEDDLDFFLQFGEFNLAFVFGCSALEVDPKSEDENEQEGYEDEQDTAKTFHDERILSQR